MTASPPDQAASSTGLEVVLGTLAEERRRRRTVMSTSADRAARVVREQVVEGHLRSGTRLPEERLASALGVSRNTLREALSQLVAERILVREPNRGVVVATPGAEDVVDVYRVRRLLEPAAVRDGDWAGTDRLAAVREAVAEGRAAEARDDAVGIASANQHFHRAVAALAGSTRLDALMDLLLAEMRLFFHQVPDAAGFHRPFLAGNAEIADLLDAGRGEEAAAALTVYLRDAERALLAALT
jgi:DNA-binding GntR family transcriptional regulator